MSYDIVLERPHRDSNNAIDTDQLIRRRIYIMPTRQGLLNAVMLVIMLLGAINYNSSMGFILCFFLVGLMLIDALYTYRNLSGLVLSSTSPAAVFAGNPARFPITIDNRSGIARHALILTPAVKKRWFWTAIKDDPVIFDIAAGKRRTVFLQQNTYRRGRVHLTAIRIASHFPLGLFYAWSCSASTAQGIVYPRPSGTYRTPQQDQFASKYSKNLTSGTDEFSGVKRYTAGDAVKHIAWKILAKEQGLLVKQFDNNDSYQLIFNWEQVAPLGSIDARLSQLCRWILIAEEQLLLYGLVIPGINILPGRGQQHQQQCLEALALFR